MSDFPQIMADFSARQAQHRASVSSEINRLKQAVLPAAEGQPRRIAI